MLESSKPPITQQQRDPRLDFFRGIAMFIIFVAHTPGNWWVNWIPARLGFSDGADIFVFCSGMASAIAFGRVFETQGWLMGAARIGHRAWQVYWAHIALFFCIVAQLIVFDKLLSPGDHSFTATYNLTLFFDNIRDCILGLLTLTYVPNYWDILPMYIVILLLVPVMMWLYWQNPLAPFIFVIALWGAAGMGYLNLPAEPWSNRTWFFNPFAWQLLFFTGFAIMRGWIPVPPIRKNWMIAAGVVLLLALPFSGHYFFWVDPQIPAGVDWLQDVRLWLQSARETIHPLTRKTQYGLFRYMHFLALAYLAYSIVTLLGARFSGILVDTARKVGQQSLPVFLASLFLAQTAGLTMHLIGHSYVVVTIVNLLGFAGLVAVAHIAGWFKAQPWKRRPIQRHHAAAHDGSVSQDHLSRENERGEYDPHVASGPRASPAE